MSNKRRSFIKKALGAGAVIAASSATAAVSSSSSKGYSSNGVVIGKSPKKEILYKENQNWDAYYKANY